MIRYLVVLFPPVLSIINSLGDKLLVAKYMFIIISSYTSFLNSNEIECDRWIKGNYLHCRELYWLQLKYLVRISTKHGREKTMGQSGMNKGPSGVLVMFCFLVLVLVTRLCPVGENALSLWYIHISVWIVHFNKK